MVIGLITLDMSEMSVSSEIIIVDTDLCFPCPHCGGHVIVAQGDVNCSIFRHGVNKQTLVAINPHASRSVCDALVSNNSIYGCGAPFKITPDRSHAIACDYV
jgi:hypothetical protein